MRRALVWLVASCILVAAIVEIANGRVAPGTPLPTRCDRHDVADATLFLLGDAGDPRKHDPMLHELTEEARASVAALGTERVAIVYLGDNIYPEGLRAAEHEKRKRDEKRLGRQLDVVQQSGARGLFVPGNHDWSNGGADGWDAIRRQGRYIDARGARMLPPKGCPGPASVPLGDGLELVALDTQWWLHRFAKPSDASAGCAAAERGEIEAAIATALRDAAGRHAIVLGHHPLASGGPHGARAGWREHLFPLRELDHRLWIPLPVIGSIWPVLRMRGIGTQELTSPPYREMAAALGRAFAAAPPLVFAAGHDHTLQVLRAGPARFQVVSGAGSEENLTWSYAVDGSLYHGTTPGYARLDSWQGGAVEISVRTVGDGGTVDAYHACLTNAR